MAYQSPVRTEPPAQSSGIPDKLYFRIGEVARLCDVPAYVLRFWESEFPQLRPNKGGTGQRLYRRRDVETALRIKGLLYDEGYTIPGARQLLKGEQKQREAQLSLVPETAELVGPAQIEGLRKDLLELLALLSRPCPGVRGGGQPQQQRSRSSAAQATGKLFDFGTAQEETRKE